MKTLNERTHEAKFMAKLAKIVKRDRHNRATVVVVPASKASQNRVIIRRSVANKMPVMSTECAKHLVGNNLTGCLGNHAGFCRHSLAAVRVALADQGYKPLFRRSLEDAVKLAGKQNGKQNGNSFANDAGETYVFDLVSFQGKRAHLYMVAVK